MDAIEVGGLVVHKDAVSHPLFGRAHVIECRGRPLTAMSVIDWDAPAEIPAIANPRALPPGSGALLLNDIATRAQEAGVQKLRYAGPYPSHALFRSLLRSFRTTGTVQEFTANVLDRALTLARDEVPVDFVPAPFERKGDSDWRDGRIDRIRLVGITYDVEGEPGSLAVLADSRCLLSVGGVPIAHLATLRDDGELLDGPRELPRFTTAVNGSAFSDDLRDELAEVSSVFVPAPLAADVARAIRERPIVWDDLGWHAAKRTPERFSIHVGFLALTKDHLELFAQQLSYHLASIAQSEILDALLASRP